MSPTAEDGGDEHFDGGGRGNCGSDGGSVLSEGMGGGAPPATAEAPADVEEDDDDQTIPCIVSR